MSTADSVELEVFRAVCSGVVDEVEVNLTRTAYSPLVYEYKDYCVSLLDREFNLITQSRGSLPIFLADMGPPVKDAVEILGNDTLQEGDVFITNYARAAGQHLNNVILAQPIFLDGEIFGYFCIRAHWADVGGLVPGSMSWDAQEIFQEGVQYRGLVLQKNGQTQKGSFATIEANTRMPEYVMGDLMAQLGAAALGVKRLVERLAQRWTREEILALVQRQFDESERSARAAIAMLKNGRFAASASLDDSGRPGTLPLKMSLEVEISDHDMVIDLSNMPDQVAAPMNCGGQGGGVSGVRVAYKSLLGPDRPADEGFFRPLKVRMRPGTIVTAINDAPLAHWNLVLPTLIDLVFKAVGQSQPEVVPAGHHATLGMHIFYGRRPDGNIWHLVDTAAGGWGATKDRDGFSPLKTLFHGDNRNYSVEVVEARYPMVIEEFGFREGSGGRGKHKGGDGMRKMIRITGEMGVETGMDRTIDPAWGMAGGEPGKGGELLMRRPGEDWVDIRKATKLTLPVGTILKILSGGGGGWGAPSEASD